MVKDNVGRPPGELEVSKSVECGDTFFHSVLWHCCHQNLFHSYCQ